MSEEETVLTPITPEEGGQEPPKVNPSATVASTSAPTVKLKPVIRKPLIRKPVIGGAKPVSLKPATGTPPPPAAVPEAAAAPAAPAAPAAKPAEPQLKAVTGPIAAKAILRKTGIVAEGILTPAQAQAAKTKTSRISLESAMGVAPSVKSSAPMKTIRLRRPTDLPPAPGAAKPSIPIAPSQPSPAASAPAPAAAPAAPAAEKPAPAMVEAVKGDVPELPAATDAAPAATGSAAEVSATITQKKTLKLHRPNFKRPTVGGLRRPGSAPQVQDQATGSADDIADISTVADIADIKSIPSVEASSDGSGGNTVSGAPAWLNAMTLVAGIAALIVVGLCTWTLFTEAVGPDAGPNGLASFFSDTDYRR